MASLIEVYGSDFAKSRKKKKKRRDAKQNVPLSPMDPQEMDKELLSDVFDESLRPDENVRGLKTSVYSDDDKIYQPIQNPNVLTYENQFEVFEGQPSRLERTTKMGWRGENAENQKPGIIDLLGDPDYEEFLEYLSAKRSKTQGIPQGVVEGFGKPVSQGDQFNELLLYIFTGFFLLMLFDNIYKLGRDSY